MPTKHTKFKSAKLVLHMNDQKQYDSSPHNNLKLSLLHKQMTDEGPIHHHCTDGRVLILRPKAVDYIEVIPIEID